MFAALSGDQSSLHTSQSFARRSVYRQRTVHGMLPVLFLPTLECLESADRNGSHIAKISAEFLQPVFLEDRLTLSVEYPGDGVRSGKSVDFYIAKSDPHRIVTQGRFTIRDRDPALAPVVPVVSESYPAHKGLIVGPLAENSTKFSQVERGTREAISFAIGREQIDRYCALLSEGLMDYSDRLKDAMQGFRSFHLNLLSASVLSTVIGMRLPGRFATFLAFSIDFQSQMQLNHLYKLASRVRFVSKSTNILVQDVSIFSAVGSSEREACRGTANVRVSPPPTRMPTMKEVAESTRSLGIEGKVALVTGASRGIGEVIAKYLSFQGCRVIVNFKSSVEDADNVVLDIKSRGGDATAIAADVSDPEAVSQMISAIEKDGSAVDILVNNAVGDARAVAFLELEWDSLQQEIDVTVRGAFNACQAVLPGMVRKGGGKIISLSSVFSEVPPPNQAKYVTAKSALTGLTRSLAVEFAPDNIQVNLVVPSIVETDLSSGVPKISLDRMRGGTPMKRHANPIDVAKAVGFLASDLSSFTTGQKIMVTGGNAPLL